MNKRKMQHILLFLFLLIVLAGCSSTQINNTIATNNTAATISNAQPTTSSVYSLDQIQDLRACISSGSLTFDEFEKKYYPECVRETFQGSYAVLKTENGKAFVFVNKEQQLISVMSVEKFKTKEEFEELLLSQPTIYQMLEYDPNTYVIPASVITATLHMVQDGAYMVEYLRYPDIPIDGDPVADCGKFISHEELIEEDYYSFYSIPYILEEDKLW